jgi:hypothetical protein
MQSQSKEVPFLASHRLRWGLSAVALIVVVAVVGVFVFLRSDNSWWERDTRANELRVNFFAVYSALTAKWIPTADLEPVAYTDMNPYGVNVFFDQEAEEAKIRRSLELIKAAGFGWVKQQLVWSDIEIPVKGQYYDSKYNLNTWAKWDRIVDLCQEYDINIIFRIDTSPVWAHPDTTKVETPPDNYADYGDFVYEVVSRYKGKVKFFQIWNEPNLDYEWGDKDVNAADYVKLLKVAYTRAKAANPDAVILSASLASTIDEYAKAYNDLKYMQQMYDAGAKDYFDIATDNPYGLRSGPYDRRLELDDINFSRPLLLRQLMVKNGDTAKPIWAAEMGWNALPENWSDDPKFGRVTREQQARYTVQALQRAQQEYPWMGVKNIWHLRLVHDVNENQQYYYFGILGNDFEQFPVYEAIKTLATAPPVVEYGYRQETHWALSYTGAWEKLADPKASLGNYMQSSNPGDSLKFSFRGTDLTLVTKRGPSMGTVQVSIDGKPTKLLQMRNEQSYLDLYAPVDAFQERILLASGLENGIHTAELTIGPDRNATSVGNHFSVDGLIVDRKARSLRAWVAMVGGGAVVFLTALALVFFWRRNWRQKQT